jgi:hypothetical protein
MIQIKDYLGCAEFDAGTENKLFLTSGKDC